VKCSEYDGSMGWNPVNAVKDAYGAVSNVVRSAVDYGAVSNVVRSAVDYGAVSNVVRSAVDIARDTAAVQALDALRDQASSTTKQAASIVATTVKTNQATSATLDQVAALKAETLRFEQETSEALAESKDYTFEKATDVTEKSSEITHSATEKAPTPIKNVVRGAVDAGGESSILFAKGSYETMYENPKQYVSDLSHSGSLAEVVNVSKDFVKSDVGSVVAPYSPFTGRIMPKPKQEVQQAAQGDPELEAAARAAEQAEEEARLAALEAEEMLKRQDLSAIERAEAELALANALKELEAAKAASEAARQRVYGSTSVPKKTIPPLAHPILIYELQAKKKKAALVAEKGI